MPLIKQVLLIGITWYLDLPTLVSSGTCVLSDGQGLVATTHENNRSIDLFECIQTLIHMSPNGNADMIKTDAADVCWERNEIEDD